MLEIPADIAEAGGNQAVEAMTALKQARDAGGGMLRTQHVARAQEHIAALDPGHHAPLVQHLQARAVALGGRGADTRIAHVAPGEIVIPARLQTPEVIAALRSAARERGIDPARIVVGSRRNSINPRTGQMEFDNSEEGSTGPDQGVDDSSPVQASPPLEAGSFAGLGSASLGPPPQVADPGQFLSSLGNVPPSVPDPSIDPQPQSRPRGFSQTPQPPWPTQVGGWPQPVDDGRQIANPAKFIGSLINAPGKPVDASYIDYDGQPIEHITATPTQQYDPEDHRWALTMAMTEAADENDPALAQALVSAAMNRVGKSDYVGKGGDTSTLARTIQVPGQFQGINDPTNEPWRVMQNPSHLPAPYREAYGDYKNIVDQRLAGNLPDNTNGATFFSSDGRRPKADVPLVPTATYGHFTFYKPVK